MDYIGNKCPVCEKFFHADDDIVVCPDCGTPHHRECYEAVGHCHNERLHTQGYDYTEDSEENVNSNVIICRSCGKENDKNAFFCKYCAAPLAKEEQNQSQAFNNASAGPGAAGPFANPFMDPMGGIAGDTDMGDGVTAGEMAKYVKQNTPYFMRVFNNIKEFNRSRFNFCSAIFAGGYLLYRKMYKIGAILTAVQAAMMILSVYIRIRYASVYEDIASQYANSASITLMLNYFSNLASADLFVLYLPSIMSVAMLVMRIVIGITANRMYFKHCKQQITLVKSQVKDGGNPDTVLQTKGGVNMPLAISLLVANLLISYLPSIISGIF